MASVNTNVRTQLPASNPSADATTDEPTTDEVRTYESPSHSLGGTFSAMKRSMWAVTVDGLDFLGAEVDEDGKLEPGFNPVDTLGTLAVAGVPVTVAGLAGRTDLLSGTRMALGDAIGTTAATGALRLTPTLASAVLGPAIADGATMVAPNLVKAYKDPKTAKTDAEKSAVAANNEWSKNSRMVAGGLVVGLAAGAIFLLKPEWFKKFGVGVTQAIEGVTRYSVDGGKTFTKLAGAVDEATLRNTLTSTGVRLAAESDLVVKTVAPMVKDAVFSNRVLAAAAGGVGTLMLANAAAGEEDPGKRKLLMGLTAAAGVATIGGAYGIGKLTQRSIQSQSAAVAAGATAKGLAANELFWKPNIEWIKKYATIIAPITAVPAGTAASQYFNVVNDFDEITSTRSPFRK